MKKNGSDIVVVSAVRTAIGKFGGTARSVPSYHLGAMAITGALERSGFAGEEVDEVHFGSCRQAGNGPNPARSATLFSALPTAVPATTTNMACPSAMKALMYAAASLKAKDTEVCVAGGMDSMSSIPYLLKNARFGGFKAGDQVLQDGWADSVDPVVNQGMGIAADMLAEKHGLSREEQDEYALLSQMRAEEARVAGAFDDELLPISLESEWRVGSETSLDRDECIRARSTIEKLAALPPAFRPEGTVTAGNSSSLADGACGLVLTTRERAESRGIEPLFSILSYADVAISPRFLGEGPAAVSPLALKRAGLTMDDMDIVEINEAFASVVLVTERALKIDRKRLNPRGGAIALGHPTGVSGARIVVTAAHALRQLNQEFALAAVGGAGGVSTAMVIRRES